MSAENSRKIHPTKSATFAPEVIEVTYDPTVYTQRKISDPLPVSNKTRSPVLRQSKSVFSAPKCTVHPVTENASYSPKSLRNLFTKVYSKIQTNRNDHKEEHQTTANQRESKWCPSLRFILNDSDLAHELVQFMAKKHSEENILFLLSVDTLSSNIYDAFKSHVNEAIDAEIEAIFSTFIMQDSPKQINISSRCFRRLMISYKHYKELTLIQKQSIFDTCVREVQSLVSTLRAFYKSKAFQAIARSRNIFTDDMFLDSACKSSTESEQKYILSSTRYRSGCHEWKIRIKKIKCECYRQEFGVVSKYDPKIEMDPRGICATPAFDARAVYGFDNVQHGFYYASYNNDDSVRCSKSLTKMKIHNRYFCEGDVITVSLDLDAGRIKFLLNDQKVRKTISIARNTDYYPVIVYSGDCEYEVVQ